MVIKMDSNYKIKYEIDEETNRLLLFFNDACSSKTDKCLNELKYFGHDDKMGDWAQSSICGKCTNYKARISYSKQQKTY